MGCRFLYVYERAVRNETKFSYVDSTGALNALMDVGRKIDIRPLIVPLWPSLDNAL